MKIDSTKQFIKKKKDSTKQAQSNQNIEALMKLPGQLLGVMGSFNDNLGPTKAHLHLASCMFVLSNCSRATEGHVAFVLALV